MIFSVLLIEWLFFQLSITVTKILNTLSNATNSLREKLKRGRRVTCDSSSLIFFATAIYMYVYIFLFCAVSKVVVFLI